jgi:translation elongation factor EF-G
VPTPSSRVRIHIYGHESADPQQVATYFGASLAHVVEPESELAIFVVDPSAGISPETISLWQELDEYQIPRMVVVTHLENQMADFDDAVMLASRVFDQIVTPYLVLHDDAGFPCALISLETLEITDYSHDNHQVTMSTEEHQILVSEFRQEYLEHIESSGENAFAAGLLFPAIPLWIEKDLGVNIIRTYIDEIEKALPSSS